MYKHNDYSKFFHIKQRKNSEFNRNVNTLKDGQFK